VFGVRETKEKSMTAYPMWKLRRLAPRALRVLERRKSEAPVLAAYEPKLVPLAQVYIAAYDRAAGYRSTWLREMAEDRGAIATLASTVQGWVPLVAGDIANLNASDFAPSPVADDVVTAARLLIDMVAGHVDAEASALPYRDVLIADVGVKIAAGLKERAEAEAADREYQQILATARVAYADFNTVLQAFRKSLGTIFGRNDKDFQKLRVQRAAQRDDDDDPGAPVPELPDAPGDDEDDIAA
jgi:hypothetical protein